MAFRLFGKRSGEVGSGHQTGDRGVSTEEIVANRDDTDIVAADALDERSEYLSP